MKVKYTLLAALFILGCSSKNSSTEKNNTITTPVEDAIQEDAIENLQASEYQVRIGNQVIFLDELNQFFGDDASKTNTWFRITTYGPGTFNEVVYKVDRKGNITESSEQNLGLIDGFLSLEAKVKDKLAMKGPTVSLDKIKEMLRIQSFYDLYRCRYTDLANTLAQQDLMFSGDWHFAVVGYSKYLEDTGLKLTLVMARETGVFEGIAFFRGSVNSKSYMSAPPLRLLLYLNIPEELYIGKSAPPVSGNYSLFRRDCDEFYELHIHKDNDSGKLGIKTMEDVQKNYLPAFDEEFEKSLYTPELPHLRLPLSIVNKYAIEEYGMTKSRYFEAESLSEFFFSKERFPISIYSYQNDPLWKDVINKGANQ